MTNKTTQPYHVFIGFLIFIAVLYFLYTLVNLFIQNIDKIDPTISAAIIAAFVSIVSYYLARYFERQKIIEEETRKQKIPAYESFIDILFRYIKRNKTGEKISQEDLEKFMLDLNKKALLYFSDQTLKSFVNWRTESLKYGNDPEKKSTNNLIEVFAKLLLDFRKDIGHKNNNLKEMDILSVFINDLENLKK